ncbi:peptidase S8 [Bacillus glycinifermentans]|uniref:S8 family peptidase n=1 Tax=Bacillus glycinifermentans TaxID=1664069 RepID=UPI0006547A70|nr:S8 family peptidase [Bacillus glycinifermentans]KMM57066.1 peptidase S8 [Bacillus glycinifermentans]MEC0495456.1 S8 family serine peptidase [Bacillus glycinifermentans]MEC0540311.1 S8 family serine peptidase [Bacillus glycinifermentans]
MKRKLKKKAFCSMLSGLLAASMLMPSASAAESASPLTSYKEQAKQNASIKKKISSSLVKQFKKEDQVTFLIKMKDQVDTQKVAKQAEKKAKSKSLSSAKTEYQKRSAIVSSLRIKADETQSHLQSYLKKQAKKGKAKDIRSFYIVNGMAVRATKDVMEQVASFPEVEKVLPNETRHLIKPANKSVSKKSVQASDGIEWNIDQIGAPKAWEAGYDGSGTVVASIDTGVQWDHPALKEKYRGYDPAHPDSPDHEFSWFDATAGRSEPYDDLEHGTHVTGTMAGSEPGGKNQIGVAPGAKWIAVKAFSEDGGTDEDLLEAGEWILAPKDKDGNPHPEMAPDVVNNSWAGNAGLDEWYRDMVKAWRAAGIFPEFSAGNVDFFNPGGPASIANPANYPEAFATGATDINKKLGDFSLLGPSPYDETKPEITAPGVNIRSSVPGSGYQDGWDGTSMAGPHVSAVAALLKQADSSLSVDEIEQILMDTATPLTDSKFTESPNNGYGHGLVNAYEAVSAVTVGLGKAEGTVGKEGEDQNPPAVSHEAQKEVFAGVDIPFTAEAEDDVSIVSVKLSYKTHSSDWQTVDAKRISGDHKKGSYEAVIPSLEGKVLTYKWIVADFGGNQTESDVYEVPISPAVSTGYKQDFEKPALGWSSNGEKNSWQQGVPESGPKSAASGKQVYGTNLTGPYDDSANMNLLMPPVHVPQNQKLFLHFKYWHEFEEDFDYGFVFIQPEGKEEWVQVIQFNGVTPDWMDEEIDLSQYAGQTIKIMFNLQSDDSISKDGLYIDDVELIKEPKGVGKKSRLGVEKRSAGMKDRNSKKQTIDPKKAKPADAIVRGQQNGKASPAVLPLRAKVSVLETGKSTYSSQADGSYSMAHSPGTYTMKAEAYGYESSEQTVTIEADKTTAADFVLKELKKGTITGTVKNKKTGEPVRNAKLYILEDAAVKPVQTDENGKYSITAYENSYTVKVGAKGYYSSEFTVDLKGDVTKDIELDPYLGYPGEIGYDDGTAENAYAFYDKGNAFAVKMTLDKGQEKAMLKGGRFKFWGADFPDPGGTDFAVEVYDASGDKGSPGKKIAGPFKGEALRNGDWTEVDLSEEGIIVGKDFYLVYVQTNDMDHSPGLATDEDGEYSGRSFQFTDGAWSKTPAEQGNFMIRALVDYEVSVPVITSPKDGLVTNQKKVVIEGTSSPTTTVHLFNGKEEIGTAETTGDGTFSTEIELQKGENVITAKASAASGTTDASSPVRIILDQTKPRLSIDSPEDGSKLNKETVTVKGTVSDDNLDSVKVNGKKATVENGQYSARILLDNGKNEIKVTAADTAGNKTTKKRTIDVNFEAPNIANLKPDEDRQLKTGETVKIEFESSADLDAVFVIRMPLTNVKTAAQNVTELPLREVSKGKYEGYWTATSASKAKGAEIEVIVRDDYGNEARKTAKGKLYINEKP